MSRACDQCRASRERCDGESKCQTCVSQNRSCTYNAQPKKRGIQPNYIRTLELTLAWLLQTFPDVELQLAKSLPQDDQQVTGLLRGKDADASEALHLVSNFGCSISKRKTKQELCRSRLVCRGFRCIRETFQITSISLLSHLTGKIGDGVTQLGWQSSSLLRLSESLQAVYGIYI